MDGASRAASAPRYGWVLQLRNTAFDVRGEDMTYLGFRALATVRGGVFERSWVDDAGTPADPADDLTYKGISLRRLVARIDDGDPATFNKVRAVNGLRRDRPGDGRLQRHLHERRDHDDRLQDHRRRPQ